MKVDCFYMIPNNTVWFAYDRDVMKAVHASHRTKQWFTTRIDEIPSRPNAQLEIRTTDIIGVGAGEMFWGSDPQPGRVESPKPNTLYCVLDAMRFEALHNFAMGNTINSPVTGKPVKFLSLPIRGGGSICMTIYDKKFHENAGQQAQSLFTLQAADLRQHKRTLRGFDPRITVKSEVYDVDGPSVRDGDEW